MMFLSQNHSGQKQQRRDPHWGLSDQRPPAPAVASRGPPGSWPSRADRERASACLCAGAQGSRPGSGLTVP